MEILELFNPWWKGGEVPKELSHLHKRKIFGELVHYLNKKTILIISGLRRIGKTTLMYQLIEELIAKGHNPRHILYFTFDQKTDEPLKVFEEYATIANVDWKKEKIFVFFDEIQKLEGWNDKIKIIYDRFPNIKLVLSGSSSFLLEKAAISSLAGRSIILYVDPLDFAEYLELKGSKIDLTSGKLWEEEIKTEFSNYLTRPFPGMVKELDLGLVKSSIKDFVLDKILKEDLPGKFKQANADLLNTLVDLFYNKPGMYINYDELAKELKVSKKTLMQHVYYLEFSYLIRKIKNYRPSSRSLSRKLQRIYPFHWSLGFGWTGKLDTETIVASIVDAKYYWRDGRMEVDFLVVKDHKITPIEVKEGAIIDRADKAKLLYFMRKFRIDDGKFVYNGKFTSEKADGKHLVMMPLSMFALKLYGVSSRYSL